MAGPVLSKWTVELFSDAHERTAFSCGKESLDVYLKQYASQNQKKNVGRTFVAVKPGSVAVMAYYTLSSGSVSFVNLPKDLQKGLPKYPVPVVHMGRLAVSVNARGCGLGSIMLFNALKRTVRASIDLGICGMEVYALDDEAMRFYLKFGFTELADDKFHLYLPIKMIQQILLTNP